MPTYDYKCKKCEYLFEIQQKITEEPLKHCPKCKGKVMRLISPAGIIFKGSGFHVTDYGKKPQPEKKAPEKGGTESPIKKDEKPAPKKEEKKD